MREQKAYWRQQMSDVEPETVNWRYDDGQGALVMTMEGEGKLEWDGDDAKGATSPSRPALRRPASLAPSRIRPRPG